MAHINKKQVALYLTEEEIKTVSIYADKFGVSRTKLMSRLISEGLKKIANVDRWHDGEQS